MLDEVNASIQRASNELEAAWGNALSFAGDPVFMDATQQAARRLISYNPQSPLVARAYPQLSEAVECICNVITDKMAVIAENEGDVDAWKNLLFSYLLLGDYPNAYSAAAHIFKICKKVKDWFILYCAGIVYNVFKFEEHALSYLNKAKQKFSKCSQFPDLYFRMALILRQSERYSEAEPLFKMLMNSPPGALTKDDIRFQHAFTLQLMGKTHDAQSIYDSLYNDHPDVVEVKQQYVWFLSLQNDTRGHQRAKEIYSLPENQNDPLMKFAAARIATKKWDTGEAHAGYSACTEEWTQSPLFWGGLGVLYLKNEQEDDAIVAFKRALVLRSDIPELWLNLGLVFECRQETESAGKVYQTALVNCKDDARLRERCAIVNQNSRMNTTKQQLLKEVVELDVNKYFQQPVEVVAERLLETPPDLSLSTYMQEKGIAEHAKEIFVPFKSLFA